MKIFIGVDHGAAPIKKELAENLKNKGYELYLSELPSSDQDDYPDFAFDICTKMDKEEDIGVLICRSGIGMSIAANKVKGIRCARVVTEDDATTSKQHNGANVIALSVELGLPTLEKLIEIFVNTEKPNEERHLRRVGKIIDYENGAYNEL